jgi:hypothetical protein
VIQLIRRRSRAALLLVLSVELLLAAVWRWPWTAAAIQTPFDYGTGHVAVVSENWRRHGAFRQHFLPVMSIDLDLPEWPYRGAFSQEYTSVPPLAFILHYAGTRALPGVEPVLLGKLLAQGLLAASTVVAAFFLHRVFGAWPTLVGLSFLIWGVPSILWFANARPLPPARRRNRTNERDAAAATSRSISASARCWPSSADSPTTCRSRRMPSRSSDCLRSPGFAVPPAVHGCSPPPRASSPARSPRLRRRQCSTASKWASPRIAT